MILIVDDKAENITALKKTLEAHKLQVDTALSGEEALKKILKHQYELVILDVQMPDMDGFEVAEAISGFGRTSDLPIIFLSAVNISKQFITKGYASGGHDYLVKPFDPDILVLKIRTFIKLHQQAIALSRMQQELLEEIEQRKLAEAKKDEFISIASHELKTPLTSVKGYMQLAELSVQDDQKDNALRFLDRSSNQLNKLNQLIGELLDISKMASGKLDVNGSDFKFEPFLDNVIDIFQRSNPEWQVIRNGYADVMVHADEMRIEQVLLNYLSNAIKYSPDGNKVYITVALEDDQLKVSVRDTGIGISKPDQANLFEKFYRVTQSSNKYQGLGMGLYICAEIIKRHSGTYGVQSELGQGATFYFTLPLPLQL
ncbi:ATP-binding response regulator [Taibaiella koreensis]|uniref:ATP-binding response regulator n=1 Tax=Taibaiella koreensis TaxID=1268548 RepID=UPI000E5A0655|nr:ATP-binding protein [Taibaiella koreensis]